MSGNRVTPLCMASHKGHDKVVEHLLKVNADPKKKLKVLGPFLKKSPLNGYIEIVELLEAAIENRKKTVRPSDSIPLQRTHSENLKPGGRLIMTLRYGPVPDGRPMADVPVEEVLALGRSHALEVLDLAIQRMKWAGQGRGELEPCGFTIT